jgi:MarR family transcriptional regulator, temperature-dependent positive regulator of motility
MTANSSEIDFKALQVLEKSPRINQRELASQLGVSLGKANYCVKALLAKGQIKVQNFKNSQNKWAYAYVLTPAGIAARADLTVRFLQIKVTEYEALKCDIEVLKAQVDQDALNTVSLD